MTLSLNPPSPAAQSPAGAKAGAANPLPKAAPATIPDDLQKIADNIARDIPSRVSGIQRDFAAIVIARALMAERQKATEAERERCAEVAAAVFTLATVLKNSRGEPYASGWVAIRASRKIATAIRSNPEGEG